MAKQHSHGRGRPLLATEHRHFAMLASVQGAQWYWDGLRASR